MKHDASQGLAGAAETGKSDPSPKSGKPVGGGTSSCQQCNLNNFWFHGTYLKNLLQQDCSTPWISTIFGSWSKGGSVQPVGSIVTDPCFQTVNLQANAPLSISTKKEQPKKKERRPGELAF